MSVNWNTPEMQENSSNEAFSESRAGEVQASGFSSEAATPRVVPNSNQSSNVANLSQNEDAKDRVNNRQSEYEFNFHDLQKAFPNVSDLDKATFWGALQNFFSK